MDNNNRFKMTPDIHNWLDDLVIRGKEKRIHNIHESFEGSNRTEGRYSIEYSHRELHRVGYTLEFREVLLESRKIARGAF